MLRSEAILSPSDNYFLFCSLAKDEEGGAPLPYVAAQIACALHKRDVLMYYRQYQDQLHKNWDIMHLFSRSCPIPATFSLPPLPRGYGQIQPVEVAFGSAFYTHFVEWVKGAHWREVRPPMGLQHHCLYNQKRATSGRVPDFYPENGFYPFPDKLTAHTKGRRIRVSAATKFCDYTGIHMDNPHFLWVAPPELSNQRVDVICVYCDYSPSDVYHVKAHNHCVRCPKCSRFCFVDDPKKKGAKAAALAACGCSSILAACEEELGETKKELDDALEKVKSLSRELQQAKSSSLPNSAPRRFTRASVASSRQTKRRR